MEFKFYDEVDPDQVNELMLISHNEPADRKTVNRIRKKDPFCSPWFRMYAVEDGRVVAQVGAAYPEIETTEGRMKAGFVEAVATMPSYARQGYAKKLMKRVHEQMIEDDIGLFVLGTSRTLVAYSMYPKLGYHDIVDFSWAMKNRGKHLDTGLTLKLHKHKVEDGNRLFRALAKGSLGFIHRPDNYPILKSSWGPMFTRAVSFSRGGKPVGYAYVREIGNFLIIREFVCPDMEDYGPCLQAMESRFSKGYVTRSFVGRSEIARRIDAHGFQEMEAWSTFMARDAKGRMTRKQVKALLGMNRDIFQIFGMDTY